MRVESCSSRRWWIPVRLQFASAGWKRSIEIAEGLAEGGVRMQ